MLLLGGLIVAMYSAPIFEYETMWRTPIGRLVDTPSDNAERVVMPPVQVGSYHPYAILGWSAFVLGVIILVSAKATQIMVRTGD